MIINCDLIAVFRVGLYKIFAKICNGFLSKHRNGMTTANDPHLFKCIKICLILSQSEARRRVRKYVIHYAQRNLFFLSIHRLNFF